MSLSFPLYHRENEEKKRPTFVAVTVVINDDIFIREYALDNVPVLQFVVV